MTTDGVRLGATLQVRRSSTLILRWHKDELVFENFLLRRNVCANALLADLLSELEQFKTIAWVRGRFVGASPIGWDGVLRTLLDQGILVAQNSATDRRERVLGEVWKWATPAQYFHFGTKDGTYKFDPAAEQIEFQELAVKDPAPSPFKDYPDRPFIKLPEAHLPDHSFRDVLLGRRTKRWFKPKALTRAQLASILFYTWGMTARVKNSIDERILRTSPSGGCRHPIEVYPLINRVAGIEPGIYHYSVRQHGLELLKAKQIGAEFVGFCSGQQWVDNAAVLFIMTAVFPRTMWRYRFSRAYRVVQMEAGHLGQTLQLTATALGLDSLVTAALQDSSIERELGVDGFNEAVIYCGAIGRARSAKRLRSGRLQPGNRSSQQRTRGPRHAFPQGSE
jgi:SagB-type dehydrogenase family enzyme